MGTGGFDSNLSDLSEFMIGVDTDWLVPYDGAGGVNDITGALLIDANTGVIDQATYLDATDPVTSLTLAQLDQMYLDEQNGNDPRDDSAPKDVPEPASAAARIRLRRLRDASLVAGPDLLPRGPSVPWLRRPQQLCSETRTGGTGGAKSVRGENRLIPSLTPRPRIRYHRHRRRV